uniref:Beta-1,3-glucanase n=1 Tax=Nepenthes alata TaxID=4376 RepID=I7H3Q8_NEPAL|nr:beta-1,3-glucanase [Nepenthes alata]
MMLIALALALLFATTNTGASQIGTCFGMRADNLQPLPAVVAQYNRHNIERMRIYGPNPSLSQALSGSGIELMLGVLNQDLQHIASSQSNANSWVQDNIGAYPNVHFRYVAVGNEIRPNFNNGAAQYAPYVLPAMQNLQKAINQMGYGGRIKVSTAMEMGIAINTSPPSAGQFDPSISNYINPIVSFMRDNGSPLLLNCYPYFAYAYSSTIDLSFALFTSTGTVVHDGQYAYQNLFDAMVDSIYSALEKAGCPSVAIVVSESGWPTMGDKGTSIDNAKTYNNNLIQNVKKGTPKRPGAYLETYIFDMYNEDLKTPEREKHWGLFTANGDLKYPVNFN